MSVSWKPDWAVHPGEILDEELRERGIPQSQLAQWTGFTPKHINQVIKGHVRITVDFALYLEERLGTSAEFWLNLQQAYDLHHERKLRAKRRLR